MSGTVSLVRRSEQLFGAVTVLLRTSGWVGVKGRAGVTRSDWRGWGWGPTQADTVEGGCLRVGAWQTTLPGGGDIKGKWGMGHGYSIALFANSDHFTSSFPIWVPFIYFGFPRGSADKEIHLPEDGDLWRKLCCRWRGWCLFIKWQNVNSSFILEWKGHSSREWILSRLK